MKMANIAKRTWWIYLTNLIKRIKNSTLFKSAGTYTIASFLNAAIPFLLMPVLTRYLSPVDYGTVAMFSVLVSFVSPFTGLSIHGAIARQYFELNNEEMKVYVTNCLIILVVSSCLVGFIFYIFAQPISKLSEIPVQWLWAVILVSLMSFISRVVLTLWQVQIKPVTYGSYQNSMTLTNVLLSVIFVVYFGMAWQGRLQAIIINASFFGLVAIWVLYRQDWFKFSLNKNYVKNAINFGVPLIPTALKDVIITIADRMFITNMVGIGATGLYTVGYQFSLVIALLAQSFNLAFVPWLYKNLKLNDNDINVKLVKFTYLYFLLIMIIAVVWAIFANWMLGFFVGPKFVGAGPYIIWISIGFAFSGMHSMVVNYIYYAQKTKVYGAITILIAVINIILNYFFILRNGVIGAAQATALTYLIGFIAAWWLSIRIYKMPWIFWKAVGK